MIGYCHHHGHGQLRLQSQAVTSLINPNEYKKVSGTFIDGQRHGFEVVNNKLKYTGPSGACFHFSGSSDLQVNKACQITYGLFINGQLAPGSETPHTFPSPAKISSISITVIIKLNQGDELETFVKSDTINTDVTISSLGIVCWS